MEDSIKLSVTVRSALKKKYSAAALKKIDAAVAAWIAAEKARGITTVLVALDSPSDMKAHGATALAGTVTAVAAKRAIDALAKKLSPDYIVLIGGDDVIPYFRLVNPIFDPDPDGDPDQVVLSDNPYASSRKYVAKSDKSYLVPDRVLGRLPDLPAENGKGDASVLIAALKSASAWKPQPRTFFKDIYATSTETWQGAGRAMMTFLGYPTSDLMVAPPVKDATATARNRLARSVHMTKCHGDDPDARFFGESRGGDFPPVLFSPTLAKRVKPGALVAAVCCYGAGVFAPDNPLAKPRGSNALPIPIVYLNAGALGFMGSTKIAYVGTRTPMCADIIVMSYLKKALDGASLGRALLEAKQDFMSALQRAGMTPDTADLKTMLEFVLLGDPAVHPIASTVPSAARSGRAAASRRATLRAERRVARTVVAAEVEKALPTRSKAGPPPPKTAAAVFKAAAKLLESTEGLKVMDPSRATLDVVVAPSYRASAVRSAGRAVTRAANGGGVAESKEYTWFGRMPVKQAVRAGTRARAAGDQTAGPIALVVLKVQTDASGNVIRSRTLHGA